MATCKDCGRAVPLVRHAATKAAARRAASGVAVPVLPPVDSNGMLLSARECIVRPKMTQEIFDELEKLVAVGLRHALEISTSEDDKQISMEAAKWLKKEAKAELEKQRHTCFTCGQNR